MVFLACIEELDFWKRFSANPQKRNIFLGLIPIPLVFSYICVIFIHIKSSFGLYWKSRCEKAGSVFTLIAYTEIFLHFLIEFIKFPYISNVFEDHFESIGVYDFFWYSIWFQRCKICKNFQTSHSFIDWL